MHRLGDVRTAVVDQHAAPALDRARAGASVARDFSSACRKRRIEHAVIQKSRACDARFLREVGGRPGFCDAPCDLDGFAAGRLRDREGAIALEVGKIRAVRAPHGGV